MTNMRSAAALSLLTLALLMFAASAQFPCFYSCASTPSSLYANPLIGVNAQTPVAEGVASYGLYNISSNSGPYAVFTNELVGYAKVDSIFAYNAQPPANLSHFGTTVQLNGVLNVTTTAGRHDAYWFQDVVDINTSNDSYFYIDNVWNASGVNALLNNATLYGNGGVVVVPATYYPTYQSAQAYYVYGINATYNLSSPQYFLPVMRTYLSGGKPVVQVGYVQGNSLAFYDNITLNISASSASFEVSPYNYTPGDTFYDAEMVFGGEASGEISVLSGTVATLWIGYLSNGAITPFPAVATFGSDTGEAAQGITVYQSGGYAGVKEGTLDYNQTIFLSGVPSQLAPASGAASTSTTTIQGSSSTYVSSSSTYVSSSSTTTAQTTSGQSSSAQTALQPIETLLVYAVLAVVLILAAIVVILVLLGRRKPKQPAQAAS